jgi:predicted alpha/beta hydrolase family esterase
VVAFVVVPGIDGSDEGHWQSLWQAEWGADAVRIAPASWEKPEVEDWVGAVGTAYEAMRERGPVVLVAHSLGCWAAAEWLRRTRPEGVGAFLVAVPDPEGPAFPAQAAPGFTGLPVEALPCPALVVASADDPYCATGKAAGISRSWGARLRLAGRDGHLNTRSGVGAWPDGKERLRELLDVMAVG